MERAIAEMEKIKRAEEIYSRRRNTEDEDKKLNSRSVYKFLFEFLLLINIVIVIVAIQNQKYIFTENFIQQVNSYNVNIKKKIEEVFSNPTTEKKVKDTSNNVVDENDGISGEANNLTSAILVENNPDVQSTFSQEEQDVIELKEKYSIILPIEGVKTSGFGERESTNSKVTKNHTGVDIGAPLGSSINSATTGKVVQVSSSGDYGKHIRIQTDDLIVLYAHCSKICVKEGQEVKQGDKIAEVGTTGNSTGPHLHFELRLHDRFVNPEKIVSI